MSDRFTIDVSEIDTRSGRWSFSIDPTWTRTVFQDCDVAPVEEAGTVDVEVTRAGKEFLVRGRLDLTLAATCVRCLGPVPVRIDVNFSVLYVPGVAPAVAVEEGEEEAPDDGPDVEYFQDQEIVLDSFVRDTVLLEVPMNPKCEVDCRVPPVPGASTS